MGKFKNMYFHECVTRELQTNIFANFKANEYYLLDNYFKSRAITYVFIYLNVATAAQMLLLNVFLFSSLPYSEEDGMLS